MMENVCVENWNDFCFSVFINFEIEEKNSENNVSSHRKWRRRCGDGGGKWKSENFHSVNKTYLNLSKRVKIRKISMKNNCKMEHFVPNKSTILSLTLLDYWSGRIFLIELLTFSSPSLKFPPTPAPTPNSERQRLDKYITHESVRRIAIKLVVFIVFFPCSLPHPTPRHLLEGSRNYDNVKIPRKTNEERQRRHTTPQQVKRRQEWDMEKKVFFVATSSHTRWSRSEAFTNTELHLLFFNIEKFLLFSADADVIVFSSGNLEQLS